MKSLTHIDTITQYRRGMPKYLLTVSQADNAAVAAKPCNEQHAENFWLQTEVFFAAGGVSKTRFAQTRLCLLRSEDPNATAGPLVRPALIPVSLWSPESLSKTTAIRGFIIAGIVSRSQALPENSGQLCACVTRLRSLRCSFVAPFCRRTAKLTHCAASALDDQETVLGRLARAVCTACRRHPDSGGRRASRSPSYFGCKLSFFWRHVPVILGRQQRHVDG